MEKAPDADAGDASEPLTYKTWMLRVSIHCGGCGKKVKKVLQSIEGVYKIEIDSKQHQVVVTGNVESGTLIKKLIKSGKYAELWTQKYHAAAGEDGERKTEQVDGQPKDNNGDSSGDDHSEEKGGPTSAAAPPGGSGGKKKKKKKKKKGNAAAAPTNAGAAPAPAPAPAAVGGADAPADPTSVNPPHQQAFSYPQFYYSAPEYGMSYNAAAPTATMAASCYTLPTYSYTYFQPDCYPSDPIMDEETGCTIM